MVPYKLVFLKMFMFSNMVVEEVERDLNVLGVRRQRELVTDRKKWWDIVQQAKAHSGL